MGKQDKTLQKCDELIERLKQLKKGLNDESKFTRAEKAAIEEVRKVVSSKPLSKPNVLKKTQQELAEQARSQHLANMLQARGILGTKPPPRQPTDQELFGHLIPNPDVLEKAEKQWGNAINNWLSEASKPISSRFASPEEEEAYWNSIKVADRDDGRSGY